MTDPQEHASADFQKQWAEMAPVLFDTLSFIQMIGDSLTEETVAHLGKKVEQTSHFIDFLGDERILNLMDNMLNRSDSLIRLLDQMIQLEKSGTLEKLLRLFESIGIIMDALTEETISHLSRRSLYWMEWGDQVTRSQAFAEIPRLLHALDQTMAETKDSLKPVSLIQLLKLAKQKEVQWTIQFVSQFLKNVHSKSPQ
ncbi:DUF1641 domain-containing protein [Melghirimyces algeriensis]|uniref:Uncharacterized conserved protein YjgD, DUF1641 family n=1 Tax=Melghirimyces algeriensis TaxID=910412 RepID=A0A521F2C8_9BACL|nr:DUF1641 domain-containing protein [Melghirimyces algeriensis]SMO90206.1 Uncharacterized conserved protein YjgD, DUF1641 family [Melghirimyces algeriensis]